MRSASLATALAALWALCAACSSGTPGREGAARSPRYAWRGITAADGITLSTWMGDRLTQRLRAAQVVAVPRRVALFEIGALPEIVVTRARLEVFDESPRRDTAPPGSELAVRFERLAGRVHAPATVTLLGGVECLVVRDGAPVLHVAADRGSVAAGSRNLVLNGVEMTHVPTGRAVRARRAVWRGADFWVSGEYVFTEGQSRHTGRGARFDLEMKRSEPP